MKQFIIDLGSAMPKPDLDMPAIDAPIISALNLRKKKRKKEKKIYYLEFITDLWSAMLKPDISMTAIDAPIISAFKSMTESFIVLKGHKLPTEYKVLY
jgi:hypothetical protein